MSNLYYAQRLKIQSIKYWIIVSNKYKFVSIQSGKDF